MLGLHGTAATHHRPHLDGDQATLVNGCHGICAGGSDKKRLAKMQHLVSCHKKDNDNSMSGFELTKPE